MSAGDWRTRAACAGVDPEMFFPVAVAGPALKAQVAEAKRVCAGCPVPAECLAWALGALADGIAGGMTADERRGLVVPSGMRPVGPPPAATPSERAEAGRAAIRSGWPVARVAAEFGVTERTAARWAAAVRRERSTGSHETGRGAA